eukprot:1649711-Pleurochrysis_carterae.AAC.1
MCGSKIQPPERIQLENTKSVLWADIRDKYCRGHTDAAKRNVSSLFVYIGAGIAVGAGFALYRTLRRKGP